MRSRIAQAKISNPLDAKIGPGRLQDLDLLSQAGCLVTRSISRSTNAGLEALFGGKFLTKNEFAELKSAANQLWSLQLGLNILFKGQVELEKINVLDNQTRIEIFEKQTLAEVKKSLLISSSKINTVFDKVLSNGRV